jgi:hypothetical protein
MQINIVKFDETQYWTDEAFKAKVGKIFGVYLYNPNVVTHCCELTPSYELEHMGAVLSGTGTFDFAEASDEEREALFEYLREGIKDDEPCCYRHCSDIDRMPELKHSTTVEVGRYNLGDYGETPADGNYRNFGDDKFKEAMEEAAEYVRGNGYTDT